MVLVGVGVCHCVDALMDILLVVGEGVGIGADSHQRSVCVSAGGDGVRTGADSHQSSDVFWLGSCVVCVCGGCLVVCDRCVWRRAFLPTLFYVFGVSFVFLFLFWWYWWHWWRW